jgi:hypothetical protein
MPRYHPGADALLDEHTVLERLNKVVKVSTPYGIGHMNANQVGAQTIVGRC